MNVPLSLAKKLRQLAAASKRNLNAQFEVIMEQWLEDREAERKGSEIPPYTGELEVNDDTIIPPSPPLHVLHGKKKEASQPPPSRKPGGKA